MPSNEYSTVYSTQGELELGINYAPAIVREHGLKDAHLQPLVAWQKGPIVPSSCEESVGLSELGVKGGQQLACCDS